MSRRYTRNDGLLPEDMIHCGLDHITAAKVLFKTDPSHFDSAGYIAHIGVELLLKGWLLETCGAFEGVHNLEALYSALVEGGFAGDLDSYHAATLDKLDAFESLRYPNRNTPTEVGDDDWEAINALVGWLCRSMPPEIEKALEKVNSGKGLVQKSGRVLMRKKRSTNT